MSRTLVVFGAQNSAGALAARQYGNDGYDVVLVADDAQCVRALTTVLESEGISTRTFTGDVSSPEHAKAMIRSIRSTVGPIDAVYYGLDPLNTADYAAALNPDSATETCALTYLSMTAVVDEVLPEMRSRKSGAILVERNDTEVATPPNPGDKDPATAACSYLQGLRQELACEGVHIGMLSIGSLLCRHNAGFTQQSSGLLAKP
ncbi:SDR family NAD(P)-dependent oxidoreductase [Pseudomonas sp. MM211]|uniref:SDR family NAD(P)-dependent oxidoreductase n=1 Tax=Pseudomonas sp. MM211 TaxID=2866808 RepID=UPI001CED1D7A|nr:SDR family NAD(P)-dependent oxidoreductase [Pseudomonas sp. MM211]UCJ17118.1 SDR family NAD(P)-dependent oxidoreductase [Pseudomonas sp. MM211]